MGHIISLCQALHARRIVDIGCGNGALCRELADHGYEVVGCEPSAESLERKRFQYRSVHRSGSVTFSLEGHDCGRTETSFRVVARRVPVAR